MKKQDFLNELKISLEFENINLKEETNLREMEEYDSLAVMSVIAFIDDKFSKKLSGQQLASITTVKSLMELIGIENFSD